MGPINCAPNPNDCIFILGVTAPSDTWVSALYMGISRLPETWVSLLLFFSVTRYPDTWVSPFLLFFKTIL